MTAADSRPTVLITGCTPGGIGHALCLRFAAHNYRVFATARRPSTLAPLAAAGIETFELDVTSTASVAALHAALSQLTPSLSVLVNNAGLATHLPATDIPVDSVAADMLNTNVLGPMRMVQAFAGMLIAARGTVVNIGSVAPVINLPFSSVYNASKAALHAWGDTLRVEMAGFGVDVLNVVTGGVKSNIVREPGKRLPEGSLFALAEGSYEARVHVSQSPASWETERYAESVVRAVEGRRNGWVWKGGRWAVAWIVWMFVPRVVRDWIMVRTFGIGKFYAQLKGLTQEQKLEKALGKKSL